jgi:hypothetical protein
LSCLSEGGLSNGQNHPGQEDMVRLTEPEYVGVTMLGPVTTVSSPYSDFNKSVPNRPPQGHVGTPRGQENENFLVSTR